MFSCFYIRIDTNKGTIMAVSGPNLNILALQGQQIAATRAISTGSPGEPYGGGTAKNFFVNSSSKIPGETVGVNTAIGIGDEMNLSAQAGRASGTGRTLGIA